MEQNKGFSPQQYPAVPVTPPAGWVPPLLGWTVPVGVYDNSTGRWVGLPLQALVETLLVAEFLHTQDRIDERNKVECEVASGTAVDTVKTKELEIPAGEVWYINRFNLVTPAEVAGNIKISKFPKVDGEDKKYLGTDQAASTDANYDLGSAGQLGADLRLVGGDKITVVVKVTAPGGTSAARTVTLNIYGRKARRLV
jgi:hypothetical protein